LVMELRTITPQGGAGLTIGNHSWTKKRPKSEAVDLVLIPSLDRFRVPAQTAPAVSGGMLMVGDLPDDFLTRIAASTGLRVEEAGQTIAEFRYASAASAIRQLALCNEELLKSWGVDPTSFARLKQKAVPLVAPWRAFFRHDYPPAALERRNQGTVIARYTVGADGNVSHCEIARSSGHGVLDRKTCVILKQRLRYQPALGEDGKPTPMVTAIPVRWAIPR
jgi:TonB family protein